MAALQAAALSRTVANTFHYMKIQIKEDGAWQVNLNSCKGWSEAGTDPERSFVCFVCETLKRPHVLPQGSVSDENR